jgi:death-on-curing family protein
MDKKIEKNNKIIIFKTESGIPQIDVKVEKDTVWLSQKQISQLFDKETHTINEHIKKIFKDGELSQNSTIRNFRIVQKEGSRNITRDIEHYNLDMIISVGYRVNSKRATQFRIWATNTLRDYLVQGYKVNENKLLEQKEKFASLKEAIHFIEKKADTYLLQGKSRELLSLVNEFAKTLTLLEEYDKNKIKINKTEKAKFSLDYNSCKNIIIELKAELKKEGEGGDLFGQEYDKKFQAVVNSIYQTFDRKELYNSIEEKAAHLIYLTIKDHPFADGNKRIASFLFVYFLRENNYLYTHDMQRKISNNTLVPLALLVAASDPKEKETIIKIIISLLQ